jgi:hypothetical protein
LVSQPFRGLWYFQAAGVGGEPVADEAQHLGELGGAGGAEGHVLYGVANTLLIRAANHNHLATDALADRLEDTLAGSSRQGALPQPASLQHQPAHGRTKFRGFGA